MRTILLTSSLIGSILIAGCSPTIADTVCEASKAIPKSRPNTIPTKEEMKQILQEAKKTQLENQHDEIIRSITRMATSNYQFTYIDDPCLTTQNAKELLSKGYWIGIRDKETSSMSIEIRWGVKDKQEKFKTCEGVELP